MVDAPKLSLRITYLTQTFYPYVKVRMVIKNPGTTNVRACYELEIYQQHRLKRVLIKKEVHNNKSLVSTEQNDVVWFGPVWSGQVRRVA